MRKASCKRLPHGATSAMVLAELLRQYSQTGVPVPVQRAALVQALGLLPKTTVVDRLRVLVKQGRVRQVKRGMYAPALPTNKPPPPPAKPLPLPQATPPAPPQKKPRNKRRPTFQDYTLTQVPSEGIGLPVQIIDGRPWYRRRTD